MQPPVKINLPQRKSRTSPAHSPAGCGSSMARGRSAGKLFSEPAILAFAIGGLFPAASILASWIKFRRADWIGVVILSTLVGGLITAFFTGKIEFAAIKAAPAFGLFGLVCLVSVSSKRPLMFYVARASESGGDPEILAFWNERLAQPGFVARMRRLSLVWGLAFVAEAVLGIGGSLLLQPHLVLVAEPLLAIFTVISLLA